MIHSPGFFAIVNDAKSRVKQTDVAAVLAREGTAETTQR